MTKKNSPEETSDEFYGELDSHVHKVNFGCLSIIIFLLFLFLSGSFIVVWSVNQIKAKVNTQKVSISSIKLENAEKKLQDFLSGAKKQDASESVTLTLSEEDLTSLLVKSEYLAQNERYSLSDPSATIDSDSITIYGNLEKPIKSKLTIVGKPKIEEGRLKFEVENIKAGKFNTPKVLSKGLESTVDKLVSKRLNNSNIEYEKVEITNQTMLLTGRRVK